MDNEVKYTLKDVLSTDKSSATAEIARVVPINNVLPKTRLPVLHFFVADSMGLASVNLMQVAPKAAILCRITCNDSHWAVQGHLRSLVLVPINSP